MKLPPLYTYRSAPQAFPDWYGPCQDTERCMRCGKLLTEKVPLELDQRIEEFHDFGGIPEDMSQGWFDFGSDCAKALRKRARVALASLPAEPSAPAAAPPSA